jgi:2-amino-4-hydroxy-6-hydroxymethyldihydropteridine diphosphokinase
MFVAMSYWVTAFLALGSNLAGEGSIVDNLRSACWELAENQSLRIAAVSSVYQSKPWGVADQPEFLNAVVQAETLLSPRELLGFVKEIEFRLGRRPTRRWGPRLIDIDLLLYGMQEVREPDLHIPHPYLLDRDFAFIPLLELAPDVRLPDGRELRTLVQTQQEQSCLVRAGKLA